MQGLQSLTEWSGDSGDKEEFLDLHPQIKARLGEHDALAGEVSLRCDELFEQIRTSDALRDLFKQHTTAEAIDALRENYSYQLTHVNTPEEALSKMFGDESEEKRLKLLSQYIISDTGSFIGNDRTTAPFWNTYGEKFRALTKYPPLREPAQEAERAGARRLSLIETTITEVMELRREICRRHGIQIETPILPNSYNTGWH